MAVLNRDRTAPELGLDGENPGRTDHDVINMFASGDKIVEDVILVGKPAKNPRHPLLTARSLEKALDVLNSDVYTPFAQKNIQNEGGKTIGCCKYFTVKEYNLTGSEEKITFTEESFLSITCVSGNGAILYTDNGAEEEISFKAGDSFFIPASKNPLDVSLDGSATVLTVSI
jgi:mannose-6-phosphate isomerase class I